MSEERLFLFSMIDPESDERGDRAEREKGEALLEGLRSGGIAWREEVEQGERERMVWNPRGPQSYDVEVVNYGTITVYVAEADVERARAILAGLD